MLERLVVAVVGIVVIGTPMIGSYWWFGRAARHRHHYVGTLGTRGTTYTGDALVRMALVIFWMGAMFAGLSLLPLLVWVGTGDTEGRRVFFGLLVVGAVIIALSSLLAWPGLKVWILEPEGLTLKRLFREHHIPYADVIELRELRSLTGALGVRSSSARIRVPMQLTGYDDLHDRLRQQCPDAAFRGRGADMGDDGDPMTTTARFIVPMRRLRLTAGFLGALFVFFMAWPWFLVEGEHPVRDSFIFMGIGALLWAAFAFLIGGETFQRHQPVELELRPGELAFRTLRSDWVTRRDLELVSASVETRVVVVKGQRGYRHPLVFVFTGGERIELDQFRARHMGTSNHRIAAEIRRRYFDPSHLDEEYRAASDQWLARAEALARRHRDVEAIEAYQHAIATFPDRRRLALFGTVGDLQRRSTDLIGAISSYEAHLDFAADDERVWQGLAAAYIDFGWSDLAADATDKAQQLLIASSG